MRGRPTPQPPHMNEPILTVAAERTSQLLPNTLYISRTRNISYRRTKETFTTFFRGTKLFSLIHHAWMSITFARTGRFSLGEYPRRKDAPYLIHALQRRTLIRNYVRKEIESNSIRVTKAPAKAHSHTAATSITHSHKTITFAKRKSDQQQDMHCI